MKTDAKTNMLLPLGNLAEPEAKVVRNDARPQSKPIAQDGPTKFCYQCEQTKPITQFRKNRSAKDGLTMLCWDCLAIPQQIYWGHRQGGFWPVDPVKQKLSNYGLTKKQYRAMREAQLDRCAACKSHSFLVIDHDHKTGKVRGLLCYSCNIKLGKMHDNPPHNSPLFNYLQTIVK